MFPKIRQVQIRNYKSLGQVVVDLAPFTALVGANGAGKSNFVDALTFARDCVSLSLDSALSSHRGLSIVPRWQDLDSAELGFRFLIDLPGEKMADYGFEIALGREKPLRVMRERCTIQGPGSEEIGFEVNQGTFHREIPGIRPKLSPDRLALLAASGTDEFRPIYDFLSSMRFYSIEPRNLGKWQELDSGNALRPDARNAAAVLESLREQDPDRYERVLKLLSLAVPGIRNIGLEGPSPDKAMLVFLQDIGLEAPARFFGLEMSDGTLRILGLLLAVYQLQPSSLIVIEEPEATVHPAVAEIIVQVLLDAARDRQVLITTHSPDILDSKELTDEQIRIVTSQKGRTTIAPLSLSSRQAVREHLYTPGELLRTNELTPDLEQAEQASGQQDLFAS
ncbi:MAG TPA: AAA family ATPase [Thermoanaerobaculia bacterium]|jgi:predicted ATPase|nr:AAA family ATPase [Thermoanaerobaculia bacterium]